MAEGIFAIGEPSLALYGYGMNVPSDVPERLRSSAARLSWEDCVNLLCLFEGWSQRETKADARVKSRDLAEDMRILVRALPYEWEVPPVSEHTLITALAERFRTGVMPKAGPVS